MQNSIFNDKYIICKSSVLFRIESLSIFWIDNIEMGVIVN
jgi:hypothetical protein